MKRWASVLLLLVLACRREPAQPAADETAANATSAISVPVGNRPTPEELERERLSQEWRQLQSFRQQEALTRQAAQSAVSGTVQIEVVDTFSETFKNIEPHAINFTPIHVPIKGDVSGPSVLRAQTLLDRATFSVGPIDGRWGKNSEIALYWFQQQHGLPPTGDVDEATFRTLLAAVADANAVIPHT